MNLKQLLRKYHKVPIRFKASFWFVVCSFVQKGISLITTPIFTRLLTVYEYGKYSVFCTWLDFFTIIVTLDICEGVYAQGLVKFENDKKIFASSLQGLTVNLCLGWLIIYLLFRDYINSILTMTTVQVLIMLGLMWTSAVFNFWAVYKRVQYKYVNLVLITLIVSIAKPVVSILLIYSFQDNFMARILGLLIPQLIYIGLFVRQISAGKIWFHREYWLYALKFNILLLPHYLSTSVISGADRVMIEKMVGIDEAGIYSLAYSVAMILSILNSALFQTITPWLYTKIREKDFDRIPQVAYSTMILVAVINTLLILSAPEIIHIFAPKEYYNAIYIIPPVTMSVYFMFIYHYFACFEFYYEKSNYISIATVIEAILNILLNYIFIKKYGYFAAGYTTLFCYMLFAFFHYFFMRKICKQYLEGIHVYNWKILMLITVVFLGINFLVLFTYSHSHIRYLLSGIIVGICILKRKSVRNIAGRIVIIKKQE